jgi:hypothetical protein
VWGSVDGDLMFFIISWEDSFLVGSGGALADINE